VATITSGSQCGLVGYRTGSTLSYDSIGSNKLTLDGCVKACGTTKPDCKSVAWDDVQGKCYFYKADLKTVGVQQRPTGYKFYDIGCGFANSAGGAICGRQGWRQNSAATSYDSVHKGALDRKNCVAACGTTKPECKSVAYDEANGICYFFKHTGTTINPADAGKGFAWYDARCLDCPATAQSLKI
jgi:hypothetical protein